MAGVTAAIGIDVGGTSTKGAVVTRSGEVLVRSEMATDQSAATKTIMALVDELLDAPSIEADVVAVGVGAAGFVEHNEGRITFSPNLSYGDTQVATALRARVDLPVIVDNDANAAAWGEFRFGSAAGVAHLTMVTLGTGVGSGFVVDGRLLRGSRGAGAEFGHMVLDANGPACPCGLRGCVEQFCSGSAIARMGREAVEADPGSSMVALAGSPDAITAEDVVRAAREYDESALKVLRTAGTMLGIALANLVNLLDPDVFVLGGSVAKAGEPLLGVARDELNRRLTSQRRRPVRLDVTTLGADAGILGAAALALEAAGVR